jgi:hypothetical protein
MDENIFANAANENTDYLSELQDEVSRITNEYEIERGPFQGTKVEELVIRLADRVWWFQQRCAKARISHQKKARQLREAHDKAALQDRRIADYWREIEDNLKRIDAANRLAEDNAATAKRQAKYYEQANSKAVAWEQTANQATNGLDYYRGLVVRIGTCLGRDAYTSDDGALQDGVLCAKVPELVERMASRLAEFTTPLSCGHIRAAIDVEDPPRCFVCDALEQARTAAENELLDQMEASACEGYHTHLAISEWLATFRPAPKELD